MSMSWVPEQSVSVRFSWLTNPTRRAASETSLFKLAIANLMIQPVSYPVKNKYRGAWA